MIRSELKSRDVYLYISSPGVFPSSVLFLNVSLSIVMSSTMRRRLSGKIPNLLHASLEIGIPTTRTLRNCVNIGHCGYGGSHGCSKQAMHSDNQEQSSVS